ncbi:hypothetical protein GMORB2_4034 [Geosmithia morbida]|uniref:Uncharacterized protein n=1 Tax=Geosmithia morbida TaxID=1094350 RepID=A0A9P5D6W9_9HYPO|nr:uncharacterized protein GMORB2_4034 [Geosmithia morbida]KAF4125195.1 hypothetical protein GMORB2_4034 [Geosmithia morbida]
MASPRSSISPALDGICRTFPISRFGSSRRRGIVECVCDTFLDVGVTKTQMSGYYMTFQH